MPITLSDFQTPLEECRCGHIACVCNIETNHSEDCKFRRAATCSVGIECEHGYDVCPICDPCTCDDAIVLQASGGEMADFKHGFIYRDEPLPIWKRALMVIPYFRRRFDPLIAVWQSDEDDHNA